MPACGKRVKEATDDTPENKRKTAEPDAGPDDPAFQLLRWSDLSYNLVWDIFSHLPVIKKSTYRR